MRIHHPWTFCLAALIGCGSEITGEPGVGEPAGYLQVEVATTGADPDLDGYWVSFEGNGWKPLPSNGIITLSAWTAGRREVKLAGVATNCAPSNGSSREVDIPLGGVATVRFSVSCLRRVGSLTVTVTSSGEVPPGYRLQIDGEDERAIGTTDSLAIAEIRSGQHLVTLGGVPWNCSLDGESRRTVEVPPAGSAALSFTVSCRPSFVTLVIRTVTTGLDVAPGGYIVSAGPESEPVTMPAPPNGTVEVRLSATQWTRVALQGVAPHCHAQVDGTPGATKYISVTPGGTNTVSFAIVCEAALIARLPAGRQLAFVRDGNIYLVNADGSGLIPLTQGQNDASPSWSPDGRRIAFVRRRGGSPVVYVMDAGNARLVASYDGTDPSWSPDGTRIAYSSLHQGDVSLVVADLADEEGSGRRIATFGGRAVQPAWSPDGSTLAFSYDGSDFWSDIYTVRPDGSGLTLRIAGSGSVTHHWLFQPSWSPDGGRLASVGCGEAWVVCEESRLLLEGAGGMTTLMLTRGFARPAWSPDGDVIAIGTGGVIGWIRPDGSARGIIVENGSDPAWRP